MATIPGSCFIPTSSAGRATIRRPAHRWVPPTAPRSPTGPPGRIVSSGGTITITGYDFGDQCTSCQVLANPVGSTTQTALQVSSWTGTSISAMLPASLTGLLTIIVKATTGTDAITIMAAVPGPTLAGTPSS